MVATEGSGPLSVTSDTESFTEYINGIKVRIIDTPGLSNPNTSDQDTISGIVQAVGDEPIDLILFCVRMDGRLEREDYRIMRILTQAFGQSIWEHIVFVLTYANKVDQTTFAKTQAEWEEVLCKYAHTMGGVQADIAQQIPVVVAGNEEETLPGYKSWFVWFWEAVFNQLKGFAKKIAYFSLLLGAHQQIKQAYEGRWSDIHPDIGQDIHPDIGPDIHPDTHPDTDPDTDPDAGQKTLPDKSFWRQVLDGLIKVLKKFLEYFKKLPFTS